jgi:hypothetical protein
VKDPNISLVFSCCFAAKLRLDIQSWLGISCELTNYNFCHVVQFIGLMSHGKQVK